LAWTHCAAPLEHQCSAAEPASLRIKSDSVRHRLMYDAQEPIQVTTSSVVLIVGSELPLGMCQFEDMVKWNLCSCSIGYTACLHEQVRRIGHRVQQVPLGN
jgi:hypothetical protein